MTVFALVDCNNFYASCERVFDPRLRAASWFSFSATMRSTRVTSGSQEAFQVLRRIAGVHGAEVGRQIPRLHDLRHSFAVHNRIIIAARDSADSSANQVGHGHKVSEMAQVDHGAAPCNFR